MAPHANFDQLSDQGIAVNRRQRRRAVKAAHPGERAVPEIRAALTAAERHRRAGHLTEAAALYRSVLDAAPEQPEALHWLGVLEHGLGHHRRAVELLERAAVLRPDNPQYLFHLAEVRRATGRHAEALDGYARALAREPGIADIHYGLGTTLLELDRPAEAAAALRRALALSPDDPEAHNNLGNALAALGDLVTAEAHYRAAMQQRPEFAEAYMNLGLALLDADRAEDAESCFRDAVANGLAAARHHLARCLLRLDRPREALESANQVVASDPDDADAHNTLGECLFTLEQFEPALGHYRRAVELKPDLAQAHFNIGVCQQTIGRFDAAVAAHRRALTLRPDLAKAYYNLSLIKRDATDDGEMAALESLLSKEDLAEEARIHAEFALARMHEDRGDADAAFGHYREANALKARHLPFDPDRFVGYVDRLVATFDSDFFAARRDWGVTAKLPVFIVGMPRSGTTLVEQILASHPAVHGAGELDDFRDMVKRMPARLGDGQPFPECVAALDRDTTEALARDYLTSLGARSPQAMRITDKMTGNYLRLGLIALLLPGATIIHCVRDPLDTCVSCYCQNFAHGLRFTYGLDHLGLVYRQHERLMDHWRRVLPLRILELPYEDLIADQDAVSRQVVASCELPWHDACLSFHKQTRQVRTASFWQVRQPLYATSVGRWRRFARHLGPLCEALGLPSSERA